MNICASYFHFCLFQWICGPLPVFCYESMGSSCLFSCPLITVRWTINHIFILYISSMQLPIISCWNCSYNCFNPLLPWLYPTLSNNAPQRGLNSIFAKYFWYRIAKVFGECIDKLISCWNIRVQINPLSNYFINGFHLHKFSLVMLCKIMNNANCRLIIINDRIVPHLIFKNNF